MKFDDYFIQLITVLRRIQLHRIRYSEVQISSLNIPSY